MKQIHYFFFFFAGNDDKHFPNTGSRNYHYNQLADNKWTDLVNEARERHKRNEIPSMIYAIMKGLPFESSTIMEDYRETDLPFFATVST